jgi:hypothetical protein
MVLLGSHTVLSVLLDGHYFLCTGSALELVLQALHFGLPLLVVFVHYFLIFIEILPLVLQCSVLLSHLPIKHL